MKNIPGYVDEMVEGAISRLDNLAFDDRVFFAFLTDTHNCVSYTERALYAIDEINKKHTIQFCCLGGDYLCNNKRTTKETAINQLLQTYEACNKSKIKVPTFIVKGNHDINSFADCENAVSDAEIYDNLLKYNSQNKGVNNLGKTYGYFDVAEEKIRVIWLDSMDFPLDAKERKRLIHTDGIPSAYGNEQINWFAHSALDLPEGWSVVVFSHMLPVCSGVINERAFGGEAVWNILLAYKNGTKYSSKESKDILNYDVECDFTSKGKGDVIAYICGHNHADRTEMIDKIRVISTASASSDNFNVGRSSDGEYHRKTRGSGEESAFTIFAVKRDIRKIFGIRCGAGPDFVQEY